jgi:hypothetical protein
VCTEGKTSVFQKRWSLKCVLSNDWVRHDSALPTLCPAGRDGSTVDPKWHLTNSDNNILWQPYREEVGGAGGVGGGVGVGEGGLAGWVDGWWGVWGGGQASLEVVQARKELGVKQGGRVSPLQRSGLLGSGGGGQGGARQVLRLSRPGRSLGCNKEEGCRDCKCQDCWETEWFPHHQQATTQEAGGGVLGGLGRVGIVGGRGVTYSTQVEADDLVCRWWWWWWRGMNGVGSDSKNWGRRNEEGCGVGRIISSTQRTLTQAVAAGE